MKPVPCNGTSFIAIKKQIIKMREIGLYKSELGLIMNHWNILFLCLHLVNLESLIFKCIL